MPSPDQGQGAQGRVRQEGEAADDPQGARGRHRPRDQGFLNKIRADKEAFRILPVKGQHAQLFIFDGQRRNCNISIMGSNPWSPFLWTNVASHNARPVDPGLNRDHLTSLCAAHSVPVTCQQHICNLIVNLLRYARTNEMDQDKIQWIHILGRGPVRDLGERSGQRRHLDHREGDPGLRVQDEDDHGGPQGLRHRDPGRSGRLKNILSFESKFYTFVYVENCI